MADQVGPLGSAAVEDGEPIGQWRRRHVSRIVIQFEQYGVNSGAFGLLVPPRPPDAESLPGSVLVQSAEGHYRIARRDGLGNDVSVGHEHCRRKACMEAPAVYQETGANAILSLVFDLSNGAATFKSGAIPVQ